MRFGDSGQDGMVGGLGSAFEKTERAPGITRGGEDGIEQHGFAHVMGTRTSDQDPPRVQKLQSAEINFSIAARCAVERGSGFREGGGIEDDCLEAAAPGTVIGEKIKDISIHKLDVLNAIKLTVSARRGERGAGIHGFDSRAILSQVERETAGRGEAIQGFAVCPAGGGHVVFPLIEIDAGFLAGGEVGVENDAVHADFNSRRRRTRKRTAAERQLLFCADGRVVAFPDTLGRKQFFKELYN